MPINFEDRLKGILLNKVITEADAIAGDKRFNEKKEMSQGKLQETKKEKQDNGENKGGVSIQINTNGDSEVQPADVPSNPEEFEGEEGMQGGPGPDGMGMDEFGMDMGMGGGFDEFGNPQPTETIETAEKHKRVKLMEDFNVLSETIETLKNVLDDISVHSVTDIEKSLLDEVLSSLDKLDKKVNYYMINGFKESKYEKVLYVFSHLRSELLIISNLINKVLLLNKKDKDEKEEK